MLFNEPKLLKYQNTCAATVLPLVSVLFNEPKLLKYAGRGGGGAGPDRFSALQRAEIAEIHALAERLGGFLAGFSALQRAEIAEISRYTPVSAPFRCFSALQRAEIAEIGMKTMTGRIG